MKGQEGQHRYHATVASHVPGRIRLKLGPKARHPHAMKKIKEHLEAQDGVHEVNLNPTTGSVVVKYDRNKVHASGLFQALDDIDVLVSCVTGAQSIADSPGSANPLTAGEAVDDLNRRLKISGLGLDLRTLLPLGFLGAGIWSIVKAGLGIERVPGLFFIWLAFDTFVKLHPAAGPKTVEP